jgi:hypothetical protein
VDPSLSGRPRTGNRRAGDLGQAKVGADLLGDAVVVTGDHLHLNGEPLQARERLGSIWLGAVEEGEETGQLEACLVVGCQGRLSVGGARRDCDYPAAGGELTVEHALRLGVDPTAAGEHGLRRALHDDATPAVRCLDEDRRELALIVEGTLGEATIRGPTTCMRRPASAAASPSGREPNLASASSVRSPAAVGRSSERQSSVASW